MNDSELTPHADPVVVLGATGYLGGALTRLLASDGVIVHAVGRSRDKLRRLRDATGAHIHPVDLIDASAAADAAAEISRAGGVRLAIATLGGWYVEEPTIELPQQRWDRTLAENLTTHFVAAQAFSRALTGPRPTYVAVNGIASHQPCPGSVAISVTGAGQRMLIDVLAEESTLPGVRYGEVVVNTPIVADRSTPVEEDSHTPSRVLAAIRELVTGHPGVGRPDRVVLGEDTADVPRASFDMPGGIRED